MKPLFRHEALEAHRQQWLGEVRLVRPVSLSVMVLVLIAAAVAIGTWLVLGEYTRKAHVSGVLVPDRGWIRLVAPQLATVAERRVEQGQAVHAGDVLFVLTLDQYVGDGTAQQRVQSSLRARQESLQETLQARQRLSREQEAALAQRLAGLRQEMAQIGTEAELQRQRLALAQQTLTRLESLRDERFVSGAQVNSKGEEVLALRAQLVALERQRSTLQREIAALEGQRRELPLQEQTRAGELQRAAQALAQESAENEARHELLIRAPQDGTLASVLAEPGQTVSPDVALASLVPADTRLQAQLYAPSSALGFIRPHQAVRMRVAAFPYQKFGHQDGSVIQVSSTPLQAGELAALPLAVKPDEPLYRVTVSLERQSVMAYGREQPLAAGMQLDADVMLERRRLVEWLFAPVLGVAGRL
ncbi:MAG: HlyD family efflux transporter periplasmic adaptor subunit [Burkholderiaceae bacterium]|nr:MAG: HlyD family efflux transporter periplasmic adaptor subunit [Burkholderiaceae bacterium]MBE7425047.1 HlyD family efflux transporter periplasmic adaptor subunit [Ideonella sp.]MCC7288741.1 HlyD family efflux transporter periplasmic adaptor subunit [Burkholderiaceae bacterium]